MGLRMSSQKILKLSATLSHSHVNGFHSQVKWLKCPNFAMSEMADSILANLYILADSDCRVLQNGKVVRLMENEKRCLNPVWHTSQKMSTI